MTNKPKVFTILCILSIVIICSCSKLEPQAPDADSVMDAPLDNLTQTQNKIFNEGASEFDEVYTSQSGLGPLYVATSCGGCHTGDNRGHPFTMLTRFGQFDTTSNQFLDQGAPQLQHFALQGFSPETLPQNAPFSKFIAPIVSGTGFLEAVDDADIMAMANANANHPDGVSGHPNWVHIPNFVNTNPNAVSKNGKYIGKFGRKASTYNLHQQTVQAFNQDMGITSTFLPQNPFNPADGLNPVPTADPEVSDQSINATVFYLQALQAPLQRNPNDADVIEGKQLFINIGCESCHKETLKTGFSPIQALSYQTFHPYTDLLVHNMGSNLDDGYTEGTAQTAEWRTTPLWGLGLAEQAQGGKMYLLHDGRAKSIEEAILWHGGESNISKSRYENLTQTEKDKLIKFLKSL